MELIKAYGPLMAIGGAEDKDGDCLVLKEFVRLAGGEQAKIVIITTATESPEETAAKYRRIFKKLGAAEIMHVGVGEREAANSEKSIEVVRQASGIFFTGGDQLHITALMGGSVLQETILEVNRRGTIIGGTSAGAAIMGNSMIISGESEENPRLASVELAPSTDFIVGCIIDTHFSQRGRHGRLLTAIAHFPQDIGFGIDENTAMLINKSGFKVIGEGAVTVIDGGGMSYTDAPFVRKGQSLTLADVKIHVLGAGAKFNFKTRHVVIPKRRLHGSKTTKE